jgi:hypothetical protein
MRIRWLVAGWALASAIRRLSQRTGVTDAEAHRTLLGDEVIAQPMVECTRVGQRRSRSCTAQCGW